MLLSSCSLKFYAPKELPLPVGLARKYAIARSIGIRIGRKLFVSEDALSRYLAAGGDT